MTSQLRLPIGISDFKTLRSAENRDRIYLVDKTPLIDAIMQDESGSLLITRPIRFMKTTNLSMLRYFFDIEEADENQQLFNGLAIKTDPQYQQTWQQHQGKYPVIYLSFKDVRGNNWDELHTQIVEQISSMYEQHLVIEHSAKLSNADKDRCSAIINDTVFNLPQITQYATKEQQNNKTSALYQNALVTLIKILHQHYQQEVIVLIDEYDTPLHWAYRHTPPQYRNLSIEQIEGLPLEEQSRCFFQKTVDWMTKFLSPALKDNRLVRKGVMTGVLRTAFASLVSSLNNVAVHSVLSSQYADYFGITHSELAIMLDRLGVREQLDIVKEKIEYWYNGYEIGCSTDGTGGTLLFNPWSIATYLTAYLHKSTNIEPRAYWLQTSNSSVIGDYGKKYYYSIENDLVQLIEKKTVTVDISERTVFNDLDRSNISAFWGLLIHTGYLTIKGISMLEDGTFACTVVIPNEEVWTAYTAFTRMWFHDACFSQRLDFAQVLKGFLRGDLDYFKTYLQNYMLGVVSYFDIPKKPLHNGQIDENDLIITPEQVYHMFILGFLAGLHGTHYYMQSNRESGHGRYDLLLLPKNPQQHSIIFEFKVAQKRDQLEQYAKDALLQIRHKEYHTESVNLGITKGLHLGVSFCGKYVYFENEWCSYLSN